MHKCESLCKAAFIYIVVILISGSCCTQFVVLSIQLAWISQTYNNFLWFCVRCNCESWHSHEKYYFYYWKQNIYSCAHNKTQSLHWDKFIKITIYVIIPLLAGGGILQEGKQIQLEQINRLLIQWSHMSACDLGAKSDQQVLGHDLCFRFCWSLVPSHHQSDNLVDCLFARLC